MYQPVQRQSAFSRGSLAAGDGHGEHRVSAEFRFVRRAVERAHQQVDLALLVHVQLRFQDLRGDDVVDRVHD